MNNRFEPIQWRPPSPRVLGGGVYPHSRPPFYPFPSAPQVAKGYCSWALYLDTHWGRTLLTNLEGISETQGVGAHYHSIVSHLRRDISHREIRLPPYATASIVESKAREFLRNYQRINNLPQVTYDELQHHFLTYVRHRVGELLDLPGKEILAEVDVVNPGCTFRFEGRERTYPLRARLDEVNITNHRVVERTIERSQSGSRPPNQKLAQAWLNGYALQQLPLEARPKIWSSLWNGNPIQVVLETPEEDIPISLLDTSYQEYAMRAYYWIRRIFLSEAGVTQDAYNGAGCTWPNFNEDCPHHYYRDCPTRFLQYPKSRYEVKRDFRQLAKYLLYDQVWEEDLLFYRLAQLSRQELLDQELLYEAKVIATSRETFTVELERPPRRNIGQYLLVIPEGNFFMGPRISCLKEGPPKGLQLTLRLRGGQRGKLTYGGTLQIYASEVADIYQEKTGWLKQRERSNLWKRAYKMGTDDLQKAEERGDIEVMRASFEEVPLEVYWEGLI